MWLVGGVAMPAAAHLKLQRTEPSNGAVVRRSPPAVVLEFTKAIELGLSTVRVVGADGGAVKTGKLEQANGSSRQLRVPLPGALQGRYAVRYRVVATDGHPIRGAFGFTVRAPATPASPAPATGGQKPGSAETAAATRATPSRAAAAPGSGQVEAATTQPELVVGDDQAEDDPRVAQLAGVTRLLLFIALVLLAGVTAFLHLVWPAGLTVRRVRWLLGIAGVTALGATAAGVVLQGAVAAGLRLNNALRADVVGATVATRYGVLASIRTGLLVVLLSLLAVAARRVTRLASGTLAARMPRWLLVSAMPLLVAVLATVSLAGHAGSGPAAPLGLAADLLHLAGVAVWLGGLAVLLGVVLPRRDPAELRWVVPRFSQLAFGAVVVIVATGLVQAWRQVGTLDGLVATDYGRLLLAKMTLVVLLVAAGAVSRSVVHRRLLPTSVLVARAEGPGAARLDPDLDTVTRLRRSVGLEVAIAVAVLALTAVLVATDPARSVEPVSGAPAAEATAGWDRS